MSISAYLAVPVLYIAIGVLHVFVPSTRVRSYVDPNFMYSLNGVRVLAIILVAYAGLTFIPGASSSLTGGVGAGSWWYDHYYECAISCCLTGLVCSAYFLMAAHLKAPSTAAVESAQMGCPSSLFRTSQNRLLRRLDEFYTGVDLNPVIRFYDLIGSIGGGGGGGFYFDVKMYLYLIGAVLLELFTLSAAFKHWELRSVGTASEGGGVGGEGGGVVSWYVLMYVGAMSWFVVEYLYFEYVHLYTWYVSHSAHVMSCHVMPCHTRESLVSLSLLLYVCWCFPLIKRLFLCMCCAALPHR